MTGKPKSQARHIVDDVLGGRQRASEITGHPLSIIDSWLRTGWVQFKYHRGILERAWVADVRMNQLDFVAHLWDMVPGDATERTAG